MIGIMMSVEINYVIIVGNKYMKIIAVDFDGVIHDIKHPLPGKRMGAPIAGAKEALTELKDNLNRIIIFTVRAFDEQGIKVVEDWMNYYNIPYDTITNKKPAEADIFLDDKAIRFIDWRDALNKIYDK